MLMNESLSKAIGAGARALRTDADVTLEEVAQVARRYGLPWTTGRVGDFEAGRTAPTLPTLVAATAALGEAIGQPVSLAKLVVGQGRVDINNDLSVDKTVLRKVLSGDAVRALDRRVSTLSKEFLKDASNTAVWPTRLRAVVEAGLHHSLLQDFSESDTRMCKNLGVNSSVGAAAMATLWSRTFSAERDHRAGPGTNAQHRGQISRRLKAELRDIIEHGDD